MGPKRNQSSVLLGKVYAESLGCSRPAENRRFRLATWRRTYPHLDPEGAIGLNQVEDFAVEATFHVPALLCEMKVIPILHVLTNTQYGYIHSHVLKGYWKIFTIHSGVDTATPFIGKLVASSSGCRFSHGLA